jgi:hypothetical protein
VVFYLATKQGDAIVHARVSLVQLSSKLTESQPAGVVFSSISSPNALWNDQEVPQK